MSKWAERRPEEDFYRVLNPDGEIEGAEPDLSDSTLVRAYEALLQTRTFEEKVYRMQRSGELSIMAKTRGEEAVALGNAMALRDDDWWFPSYRQTSGMLYHDVPMDRFIARLMGTEPETVDEHLPVAEEDAPPINIVSGYVPLAVNIANAAGSAMVDRFAENDTVTMAHIGDGATSEGDFYEGMNFAGVFDAPLVTICQNNQWAISVPSHRQTAAETFAQKAEAVGIPHDRVDGNDLLAVYQKTSEAVERATTGGGPTFIECVTYRMGEHNTADESSVYRDDDEREFWAERDPVDRFEAYLRNKDLLNENKIQELQDRVEEKVQQAVDAARAIPRSDPELMFENHLHGDSWKENTQRSQLKDELEGRNPFIEGNLQYE